MSCCPSVFPPIIQSDTEGLQVILKGGYTHLEDRTYMQGNHKYYVLKGEDESCYPCFARTTLFAVTAPCLAISFCIACPVACIDDTFCEKRIVLIEEEENFPQAPSCTTRLNTLWENYWNTLQPCHRTTELTICVPEGRRDSFLKDRPTELPSRPRSTSALVRISAAGASNVDDELVTQTKSSPELGRKHRRRRSLVMTHELVDGEELPSRPITPDLRTPAQRRASFEQKHGTTTDSDSD